MDNNTEDMKINPIIEIKEVTEEIKEVTEEIKEVIKEEIITYTTINSTPIIKKYTKENIATSSFGDKFDYNDPWQRYQFR